MDRKKGAGFINKVFVTNSFKKTQKLGRDFAKVLKKGNMVYLYGDLGSGKTTFVQGLAEGLGVTNRIISPTFIIVRCYELQSQNSKLKIQNYNVKLRGNNVALRNSKLKSLERFYHIDLYRIKNESDIQALGLEEIINDKSGIVVIEWAEKMKGLIPAKRIEIKFSYEKENTRKVTFSLTT